MTNLLKNKSTLPEKYTCLICGKLDSTDYFGTCIETELMQKHTCCFGCAFWLHEIDTKEKYIITGDYQSFWAANHISIDAPGCGRWGNGFGGSKFRVTMTSGETFYTDNLWHQGTVPEYFRDRLTPNGEVKEV